MTARTADNMLSVAARLVSEQFADAKDKAGEPYLGHCERVSRNAGTIAVEHGVDPTDARVVGLLHDIVEDTDITVGDLAELFPPRICEAVALLTKRRGEPNVHYYARVRSNGLARVVKMADVADNSDEERLAKLDDTVAARLRTKYTAASAALLRDQAAS